MVFFSCLKAGQAAPRHIPLCLQAPLKLAPWLVLFFSQVFPLLPVPVSHLTFSQIRRCGLFSRPSFPRNECWELFCLDLCCTANTLSSKTQRNFLFSSWHRGPDLTYFFPLQILSPFFQKDLFSPSCGRILSPSSPFFGDFLRTVSKSHFPFFFESSLLFFILYRSFAFHLFFLMSFPLNTLRPATPGKGDLFLLGSFLRVKVFVP